MLSVSGRLEETVGGPPGSLEDAKFVRRTLYGGVSRHDLSPVLRLFDFPEANITSAERTKTSVPLQGLYVLNDEFVIESARLLAKRLQDEAKDDEGRIRRAYALLFARDPRRKRRVWGSTTWVVPIRRSRGTCLGGIGTPRRFWDRTNFCTWIDRSATEAVGHARFHRPECDERALLGRLGGGFGMLGLANAFAHAGALASTGGEALVPVDPLAARAPHFEPKAKRLIFLFMNGGPSHVDTFDPKPHAGEDAGQDRPTTSTGRKVIGRADAVSVRISEARGKRHGDVGAVSGAGDLHRRSVHDAVVVHG